MLGATYIDYSVLPSAEATFAASGDGMDAHLEAAFALATVPLMRSMAESNFTS